MPDAMREFSSCLFVPMRQYLRTTVKANKSALGIILLCKVLHAQTITRRVVPMQILAVRFGVAVPTMQASAQSSNYEHAHDKHASVTRDSKMHEPTKHLEFLAYWQRPPSMQICEGTQTRRRTSRTPSSKISTKN